MESRTSRGLLLRRKVIAIWRQKAMNIEGYLTRLPSLLVRWLLDLAWRLGMRVRRGNTYAQTPPIHLRSSQTALRDVKLRRSKMFFAAAPNFPFFRLLKA